MYNERKTAQMAAWFINQSGGQINVLKLVKLLYLSDRRSMEFTGFPMTGDRMVSMPHGPVLSQTYGLMVGAGQYDGYWESVITDRENHCVGLHQEINTFDEFSEMDEEILAGVWKEFGDMHPFQIRDWTHDHCDEWKDPKGSSNPIHYETVFLALGMDEKEAAEMAKDIESQLTADLVLVNQ